MLALAAVAPPTTWTVAPYLQLGADDETGGRKSVTLRWMDRNPMGYTVRYLGREAAIRTDGAMVSARMGDLAPGIKFRYAVSRGGRELFAADAISPAGREQRYRAVVMGDSGRGLPGQWRLAKTLGKEPTSLLVHTGDVVYPKGRIEEYLKYHFPAYNAEPGAVRGIPLLRQIVSVAAPGNHDTAYRNAPEGLAYYLFWDQPTRLAGARASVAALAERRREKARGNFSFAWGSSWWVVIDANTYTNWRSAAMRAYLDRELARGKDYAWTFVAFHQPGFHSSKKKEGERYMSSIADLLTKHGVDVVFNGHVHNYQRSHPLAVAGGKTTIDRSYRSDGKARGTVYVVTGAGGAELYDQMLAEKPDRWRPETAKYVAGYSYTRLEVAPSEVKVAQIGIDGKTLDQFRLTR